MAGLLTRVMQKIGSNPEGLDEPMVNDLMNFDSALYIPVSKSGGPANWSIRSGDQEFLVPQTQEEHDRLLNTYYPDRGRLKNWKELGQEEEKKAPHFSDKDSSPRKMAQDGKQLVRVQSYSRTVPAILGKRISRKRDEQHQERKEHVSYENQSSRI